MSHEHKIFIKLTRRYAFLLFFEQIIGYTAVLG
jgi:hypothetical protein